MLGGYASQDAPNVLRSQVDAGTAKVRRRYTEAVNNVSASISADKTQIKTFDDFYHIDLQSGVNRFTFLDPVTETEKEYRFREPPSYTPITDTQWLISMALEVTP